MRGICSTRTRKVTLATVATPSTCVQGVKYVIGVTYDMSDRDRFISTDATYVANVR